MGNGGGGKSDPPDPLAWSRRPEQRAGACAGPAPSGNTGNGSGSGKDPGSPPQQTGAGGRATPADPAPATQGNTPTPAQPATTTSRADPRRPLRRPSRSAASPAPQTGTARNRLRLRADSVRGAALSNPGQVAGVGGTEAQFQPAPAAGAGAFEQVGRADNGGDGSANPRDRRARPHEAPATKQGPPIIREIPQFVEQVPPALKFALAVTGVLSSFSRSPA